MNWILKLIPIPVLLFLAGLVAGAGAIANVHYEMQKTKAREAGAPAAVLASKLGDHRPFPWFDEATVQFQISEDATYVYWADGTDGTIEYPVLFFFDPEQVGPVREVLGAISFDSYEAEAMEAYMEATYVQDGALGAIFEMTGIPHLFPAVTKDEIAFAAADLGLTMSENFLHLNPHFEGRDIRVEARPELTYIAGGASILLIWFAMIAQVIRRRLRRSDEGFARKAAKKGLVAAAAGGAKMLLSDDEEEGLV